MKRLELVQWAILGGVALVLISGLVAIGLDLVSPDDITPRFTLYLAASVTPLMTVLVALIMTRVNREQQSISGSLETIDKKTDDIAHSVNGAMDAKLDLRIAPVHQELRDFKRTTDRRLAGIEQNVALLTKLMTQVHAEATQPEPDGG